MTDSPHTLEIKDRQSSLHAYSGDLILLTGAVGSGKSLWLKRLAGLCPLPGNISGNIDGKPCSAAAPRTVRMLFDRYPPIWLGQHVGDELGFGLTTRPSEPAMIAALAEWDVAELSLNDELESLNRRQAVRLSLAAMSLAAPALVLLDNPTDSLPQADAECLSADVARWVKESNLIVVVACNRWHDWQTEATHIWYIHAPNDLPQSGRPA